MSGVNPYLGSGKPSLKPLFWARATNSPLVPNSTHQYPTAPNSTQQHPIVPNSTRQHPTVPNDKVTSCLLVWFLYNLDASLYLALVYNSLQFNTEPTAPELFGLSLSHQNRISFSFENSEQRYESSLLKERTIKSPRTKRLADSLRRHYNT